MKNKIRLANEQIEKVVNFLKENEDAFSYMDLKLHEVSFYCYTEMEKDFPLCTKDNFDYFSDFCDIQYQLFLEDLEMNYDIDFNDMYHQLGRTSKFYLHDQSKYIMNRYNKIDMQDTIESLLLDFYNNYDYFIINENGLIESFDSEYPEDSEEILNFIISDFYNDVLQDMEDILKVYNVIKNFKDNQVEIFKEYLENEEENLKLQKEEEDQEKENNRKICLVIQEKYQIKKIDMDILKKCIKDF